MIRDVRDPNFKHCTVTLLPAGVEVCRTLELGQVLDRNTINCIEIVAEVAEALARERYGKPRFRIPAGTVP